MIKLYLSYYYVCSIRVSTLEQACERFRLKEKEARLKGFCKAKQYEVLNYILMNELVLKTIKDQYKEILKDFLVLFVFN